MKKTFLFLILLAFSPKLILASPSTKQITNKTQDDCDFSQYAPVMGKDKKCYLNKCWAEKKGVQIRKGGYKKKYYKKADVYTWNIEDVCIPSAKEQPTLTDLGDGTLLYKYSDREFRGTPNRCKCLPPSTLITTPNGDVAIHQLKENDIVLTTNLKGEAVEAPIKITNKVLVSEVHSMIVFELADGRKLQVTAEHPSAIVSKSIDQYCIGEEIDGSVIIQKSVVIYNEEYTYDILPAGETGYYWANGILIGSTLSTINRLLSDLDK
jgi:hypothetical protein